MEALWTASLVALIAALGLLVGALALDTRTEHGRYDDDAEHDPDADVDES